MTARDDRPVEELSLVELLDRAAERRRVAAEAVRRARAELLVFRTYDEKRSALGHDYGGGQRVRELNRRTHEADRRGEWARIERVPDAERMPGADELALALETILAPRERRLERESYRAGTAGTRRQARALADTRRRLEEFIANLRDES